LPAAILMLIGVSFWCCKDGLASLVRDAHQQKVIALPPVFQEFFSCLTESRIS
jgi:hypothetical protein